MSTPPPLPNSDPPPLPQEIPPDETPVVAKAPPKGKLFPCLQCGAKVEFNPRERALKCPYCGHSSDIETGSGEVEERDFNEYVGRLIKGNVQGIVGRSEQTQCSGCGAMVLLEDKVVTEECPFCSTHLENKPEAVEGMLPPESLIPFAVDLREARESFDKWLNKLWFAPTQLKKIANLGQLTGMYLPYWTYDAMTYTKYRGMRGDNYQETEYYTERDANGNEVQRSRTVTKIHWYPVSGQVEHFFDDVLVCGTHSVPKHLIRGLEPWDTTELEPFQDSFLAGLKAERYGVDLQEGLVVAKEMMAPVITNLIRRDIGGDHQRIEATDTRYLGVTFKHCLLPVWIANYRYHEKLFQILINGRTAKVSGERPWSFWKIFRLVAIILVSIGLIIALISMASKQKNSDNTPQQQQRPVAPKKRAEAQAPPPLFAVTDFFNTHNHNPQRARRRDGGQNHHANGRGARRRRQGLSLCGTGDRDRRTRRPSGDCAGDTIGRPSEGAHASFCDPQ
jgi:DNA-directed RNA polymerase subunit RPC12/RpoP